MMHRRVWGMAIAVVLVAWVTGCATPTRQREAVTITFACKDYQRDEYQKLAEEFHEAYPHITVQIVSANEITGQGTQGTTVTITGEEIVRLARAADTFIEFPGMLGSRPQDIVLDLSERVRMDLVVEDEAGERVGLDLADVYPGALAPLQEGGRLWGLPCEVSTLLVYYNPRLFDEAGVPQPQIGWSWDDLLDAALRLTIRQEGVVKQYGYVDPWQAYTLPLLVHQKAGRLMTTEQEVPQARLGAPEVAEAIRWYAELATTYGVMPDPTAMDSNALQEIVYGQAPAMWTGFSWEWDTFQHQYGAQAVPLPEEGEGAAEVSAYGYFVSAGTAHPEAAWQWIEFLSRQPPGRYSAAAPARKSVAKKTRHWQRMDASLAAAFQYNLEHAVYYPRPVRWGLNQGFKAALRGEAVEAALAEAQARANEQLAQAAAGLQQPAEKVAVAPPEPTPTPGGTVVRFYVPQGLGTEPAVYRALAERFQQEHPGMVIEVETGAQRSLSEHAAAADCFVAYAAQLTHQVNGFTERDAILALGPLLAEDGTFDLDAFYPLFLGQVEIDGTLWGLPLEADARLLYYHRALFDQAGLAYPAADWTPQKLIAQAMALTDTGAREPIYGFYPRDGAFIDAAAYVAWLGGKLFDEEGYPTFDDPTVSEALMDYAGLILKASPPSAQARSGSRWTGYPFTVGPHPGGAGSGCIAMWVDTYTNHRAAPALGFEVGVAPLPPGQGPAVLEPEILRSVQEPLAQNDKMEGFELRAAFISARTAQAQACWSWIAFLSAQPEAVQELAVRRDVATSAAWRGQAGQETADAWLTILERGGSGDPLRAMARQPQAYLALHWFDEALADVLAGAPPPFALAEAQARASAFVDCLADQEEVQEAWRACARQADPDVALPGE